MFFGHHMGLASDSSRGLETHPFVKGGTASIIMSGVRNFLPWGGVQGWYTTQDKLKIHTHTHALVFSSKSKS